MAKPEFIHHVKYLEWPGYPGRCIQAQFCVADFHDDAAVRWRIPFDKTLSGAGKRRRAEYAAGRYIAQCLLQEAGYGDFILLRNADRTPFWPAGVCGTISHAGDIVLCALHIADSASGVGIDVEAMMTNDRAGQVQNVILNSAESAVLFSLPLKQRVTLAFSAKESVFKAVYPRLLRPMSFHDSEILSHEPSSRQLTLRLHRQFCNEFPEEYRFIARYHQYDDKYITLVYYARSSAESTCRSTRAG